jgi:hypothetical protein
MTKNIFMVFILGFFSGCSQNPKSDVAHANHYDENNNPYHLNWFQEFTLSDVTLNETSRHVTTQIVSCQDMRMIGKTPHDYSGTKKEITTVVEGKFAKKYTTGGKTVYLDVVSQTRTYSDSTDCEEDP